jgi:hypothetical protein
MKEYTFEDLSHDSRAIYNEIQEKIDAGKFDDICEIIKSKITPYNQHIVTLSYKVHNDIYLYKYKTEQQSSYRRIETGNLCHVAVYSGNMKLLQALYDRRIYDPNILLVLFHKTMGASFRENYLSVNLSFFQMLETILENTKTLNLKLNLSPEPVSVELNFDKTNSCTKYRNLSYVQILAAAEYYEIEMANTPAKANLAKKCLGLMLDIDPKIVNHLSADGCNIYFLHPKKKLMKLVLEKGDPDYQALKNAYDYHSKITYTDNDTKLFQQMSDKMNQLALTAGVANPNVKGKQDCLVV